MHPSSFEPDSLRILLTLRDLTLRGGSQLFTRDVAEGLRELGATPIVYSPRLGELASELRARGVAVIDDLDRLGSAVPEVIHGQHHLEAMTAMLRFPQVPAIYVCHGWLPWQEAPPRFPSLRHYVAIDGLRRDRLVLEHGIAESQVEILPNFVDLERFKPRERLPAKPLRALLLSNQATPQGFAATVLRAAAARAISLDTVGVGFGNATARPETLLGDYDLVFARGRSALEAMAVGCAVVLCDVEGCGALVDPQNFDALRAQNFGLAALRPPVVVERLLAEMDRYDPQSVEMVRRRVRAEAGRDAAIERLVAIYHRAASVVPSPHETGLDAASRYLAWLGPEVDLYRDTAELLAAFEDAQTRAFELEAKLFETQANLERTAEALAVFEHSPLGRARKLMLALPAVGGLYRRLKRRQKSDAVPTPLAEEPQL